MPPTVNELLARQSGVVARRQLTEAGLGEADVRRLMRRRELVRLHPGVLVSHTGEPTWLQRAWGAVLHAWPAVLCDASALRSYGLGVHRDDAPVDVLVTADRHPTAPPGVRVHRSRDLSGAAWQAAPPRLRLEAAVVRMAGRASDEHGAVRVLTDAVGSRRTTAGRLRAQVDRTPRLARRGLLVAVLDDAERGTHSVLERAYLRRVERAHGLPPAVRQARARLEGTTAYRDVLVGAYGLVVELDGRLHHGTAAARERDLDRDLVAASTGLQTVRLTWGQVVGDPCRTARRIGALLQLRGWDGAPAPCPDC